MKQVSNRQMYRALSLFAVILFFTLIPLSNLYANFKIAYNHPHLVELSDGWFSAQIYGLLDAFYSMFENPVKTATSNNGSLWAYTVLGVPVSDPLGLISELFNAVKFPLKYFVGGSIPFLFALIFGRFFCAWLCPMVVINAMNRKIKWVLQKLNVPLLELNVEPKTRMFMFWFGMVFSYFSGAWVWHFILPYIAFTHELFSIIVFSGFTMGAYILLTVILLDIALIPGQFCKSICPSGYFLSLFGTFQVIKIQADKSNCPQGCHVCYDTCPIDLFVKTDHLHSCHSCGLCLDVCPQKNIHFGLNPIYIDPKTKKVKCTK